MAQPFHRRVTLASANTNYNLYSLMAAIDPNVGRKFQTLKLIVPESNTNDISLGSSSMAAMDDGDRIPSTGMREFKGSLNSIPATELYVRSDAADQELMVHGVLW